MLEPEDYTIVADSDYVASSYEAPKQFLVVGSIVEKIVVGQDVDTPNSILAFVSGNRGEQVEYIAGLFGIGILLSCLVSIWFITLLLLKCQGRERMGCAAGYAFHDSESDDQSIVEERRKRGGASGTLFRGDDQDVSVGAAVGDDDSIAMDEPALRESLRKSRKKSSKADSPSPYSRFSAFLGSVKSKMNSKKTSNKTSTPKTKDAYGDKSDEINWAALDENDYRAENLDEIELHMELDDIVYSATRSGEEKSKTNSKGKSWTLRSLPPKTVLIGDESEDESIGRGKNQKEGQITKACGQTCCCSFEPEPVSRRKNQTRFVFGLFAVVSLVCCVLLMTHMYLPLESAALGSGDVVKEISLIVNEINDVIEIVDEAASATEEMIETTPLQYEAVCPEFPIDSFIAQFGFNPRTVVEDVSKQYVNYIPTISELLNTAEATGASINDLLLDVNKTVSETTDYLWIIPLIICITMLIIFSQLALMAAVVFKEHKFRNIKTAPPKVEDCFGWTVVPLQVMVVLASWVLVLVFCFGITITTDSCIPSFSTTGLSAEESSTISGGRGTPDDTVLAVLDQYIVMYTEDDESSSLIYDLAKQRLSTYITGCRANPLSEVIVAQGLLQESLNSVNNQVSFANDVLGLSFIEEQCGPTNQVRLFFDNVLLLNEQFAEVNKAIKQGYDALSCPRLNTLYVEAVHGALCTDFATANTNGLLLLIVLSFSGMILITLRASWRSAV
mmetsp:Transcript_67/g.140  ORF Transcript_67/g.140 Transcript_67/m.140 type:complete len:731 (-) Transcript_67:129-2321(-)